MNDSNENGSEEPGGKGYYEWNRESPESILMDEKENAIDSLETALTFLGREDSMKWKWVAIALHHSLYSFCIAALENGNYENVLDRGNEKSTYVKVGNELTWKKAKINRFHIKQWPTPAYRIQWEDTGMVSEPRYSGKVNRRPKKEKLIGIWTALARVQDGYFWMGRLCCTSPVIISDEDLKKIVWLIEAVRNDLMHFIPKSYGISAIDIVDGAIAIIKVIDFLVNKSYSILFLEPDRQLKRIGDTINQLNELLLQEKTKIEEIMKNKEI